VLAFKFTQIFKICVGLQKQGKTDNSQTRILNKFIK